MTTEHDFGDLAGNIDTPMFVVTTVAEDDGERGGCLVGFATQCSIDPPRFLVGLSVTNHTYGVARRATHLGVHMLDESQRGVAEVFGGETMDELDKFARCAWRAGPAGVPILDDLPVWFVGRILDRIDFGDHVGHVLEPVAVRPGAVDHMRLRDVSDIDPGHDP